MLKVLPFFDRVLHAQVLPFSIMIYTTSNATFGVA